ncbi:MAG: apolipoprotein N-acyltransferase [Pseudomonadota bacterium]
MSDAPGAQPAPLSLGSRAGLSVLCGVLAGVGHQPFSLVPISLLGLAAVFILWRGLLTWRGAFLVGWAAGVGYFGLTLHWIVEPFLVDVARHGWMAPFAAVFMASGMALFWGAAAAFAWRLGPRSALAWAVTLALAEFSRAYVMTGFPWVLVGTIWVESVARGWASVMGVHGLTLVTLLGLSGCVALGARVGGPLLVGSAAVLLGGGALLLPAVQSDLGDQPMVRLVQPNAPQDQKWDPRFFREFIDRQIAFTGAPSRVPVDLVVWPEAAIPYRLNDAGPVFAQIADQAPQATTVLGVIRRDAGQVYNTMVAVREAGVVAQYDKSHLVPFGEYVPLAPIARRFGVRGLAAEDGFGYAAGPGPRLIDLAEIGTALPLICYEGIFPHGLNKVEGRADFLLLITNDAWFGTFSGPFQHLTQAQMRAVEQGLPMVRVANTGVSAMIDPGGRITASIPLGQAGFIDARLPMAASATLYSRTGDIPFAVLTILLLLVAHLGQQRKTN